MRAPVLKPLDGRGAALALLLSLFWGANPVAIKIGLADAPPIRLAWMRFLVGGLVVLAWAWATGRLRSFRIEPGEWRPLAIVGGLFTLQIGSMNVGTSLTSAAHATVLLNLYAVHTVVLAHFLIPGDRLTSRRLAGVVVAYAGILMLFRGPAGGSAATLTGDVVMLASSFLLAERTLYLARAVHHVDHVKLLLAQAAVGTVAFVAGSLVLEDAPTTWTVSLVASIGYQGVVIAGFNFVANLWLLERYRPSVLATLFLTQPIFGVVAAAALTGDPLTTDVLVASAAVAIGVGLSSRR
jgi:drug/metabolite transporter (DMT)-like permease